MKDRGSSSCRWARIIFCVSHFVFTPRLDLPINLAEAAGQCLSHSGPPGEQLSTSWRVGGLIPGFPSTNLKVFLLEKQNHTLCWMDLWMCDCQL